MPKLHFHRLTSELGHRSKPRVMHKGGLIFSEVSSEICHNSSISTLHWKWFHSVPLGPTMTHVRGNKSPPVFASGGMHVSSFTSFYTQVSRTWVSKEQFCPVIVYSGKHWLSPSHQVLQIRNVLESKEKVSCRKYWPAATSEQQRTINETAAPRPTCILTICFPICTNRSNPWTVWPLGRHSLVF